MLLMQLLYSLYIGLTILALLHDLNLGYEKLEVYMVPTRESVFRM